MARRNTRVSRTEQRIHLDPKLAGRTKSQGYAKNGDKYRVEHDQNGYRYDICQEKSSGREYRVEYDKNGRAKDKAFYNNGEQKSFSSAQIPTPPSQTPERKYSSIHKDNSSHNEKFEASSTKDPNFQRVQLDNTPPNIPSTAPHTSKQISSNTSNSPQKEITPIKDEFIPTPVKASSQDIRKNFLERREQEISSQNKYINDPNHPDYVPLSERLKARAKRK